MYSTFGSSRLPVIWVVSSSILSCALPGGVGLVRDSAAGVVDFCADRERDAVEVLPAAASAKSAGRLEGALAGSLFAPEASCGLPGLADVEPAGVADVLTPGSRSCGRGVSLPGRAGAAAR